MADSRSSSSYLTIAAVSAAVGIALYAAYFDYKRRNDVEFRRKLKKEKKRVQKSVEQTKDSDDSASAIEITPAALKEAIQQIKAEQPPQSPEEKESYFMHHVGQGEQLAAQGPKLYLPAAMAFFRALRVYPSPVELIVIYQKTIIEPVFKLVMEMTNLDVADRIEGYFDHFPPKRTNVSIEQREPVPGQGARNVLVVSKDFAAGEVIYKEFPVVTALDADLHAKGTHCDHCLRPLETEISIQLTDNTSSTYPSYYCSKACQVAAKTQYQTLLFSLDNPLPAEIPSAPVAPALQEARHEAQIEFADFLSKEGKGSPLLVARFTARQISAETQRMVTATNPAAAAQKAAEQEKDYTDSDPAQSGDTYALADHVERLRYLEVVPDKTEVTLLTKVLQTALPGLEEFVTEDRHAILAGKMAYNAFGVCYGGGRDDKPEPTQRPEDQEVTRTPYGTNRQIGSALYTLSSYLIHSCQPSARPSFSSGTSEISIIANRDLKKGDVLSVAFVDTTIHEGETTVDARRRRRKALARGWRFACGCERCVEEGKDLTSEEQNKGSGIDEELGDGSKEEDTKKRYEQRKAGVMGNLDEGSDGVE